MSGKSRYDNLAVNINNTDYRDSGTDRYRNIFNTRESESGASRYIISAAELTISGENGVFVDVDDIGTIVVSDEVLYTITNTSSSLIAFGPSAVTISDQSNVTANITQQPSSINPGQSTSFTISVTPTTAGALSFTVNISALNTTNTVTFGVIGQGSFPFDLEDTLESAEFYLNPDATSLGTFTNQLLSGTFGGLIKCTGNGTITEDVDALGVSKPGIILSGANNGHNILNCRDTGDTADMVCGDCMNEDSFFGVFTVLVGSIGTNSADHFNNDRIFGGYTSTFGLVLRSTPIVQAGGDTGLGQITVAGPAVSVSDLHVITVRKDATNIYLSVNGGAESSGVIGNIFLLTDALCMGNSAVDTLGAHITLGKCAMFKTVPNLTTRTNIIDALIDHYGI